jgi:hypothetical protein
MRRLIRRKEAPVTAPARRHSSEPQGSKTSRTGPSFPTTAMADPASSVSREFHGKLQEAA